MGRGVQGSSVSEQSDAHWKVSVAVGTPHLPGHSGKVCWTQQTWCCSGPLGVHDRFQPLGGARRVCASARVCLRGR